MLVEGYVFVDCTSWLGVEGTGQASHCAVQGWLVRLHVRIRARRFLPVINGDTISYDVTKDALVFERLQTGLSTRQQGVRAPLGEANRRQNSPSHVHIYLKLGRN